jgi:hypothetical protein
MDHAPKSRAPGDTPCEARYRYWASGSAPTCSWPSCACGPHLTPREVGEINVDRRMRGLVTDMFGRPFREDK